MAKVIVERPRHGSRLPTKGKGYGRGFARLAWEDQPKREGIGHRGGRRKWLNEHLAPLRRYLAKQVGRPWDKIFAEICRHLDRDSAVQDHVRDHLVDYVAVRVTVYYGQLCHGDGSWIGRPLHTLFYVCPKTGILRSNPRPYFWSFAQRERIVVQVIDNTTALVRKRRGWYVISYREVPGAEPPCLAGPGGTRRAAPPTLASRWDELLRIELRREEAQRIYGHPIHAVDVRRASKREVRQHVNSYPRTNVVRR